MVTVQDLPNETLSLIVSFLDFPNRVTCVNVCHSWYRIISSSVLYQDLKFDNNVARFYRAIDLFNKEEQYGQTVARLELNNCEIDAHSALLIPRHFPNLKELIWVKPLENAFENPEPQVLKLPPKQVYDRDLEKWNQLVSITTATEAFPVATYLLDSSKFYNLTRLDVSFRRLLNLEDFDFQPPTLKKLRAQGKALIKNVKNAPNLVNFTLRYGALDLEDMEVLHSHVPKLQHLKLEHTCVYTADTNKQYSVDSQGKFLTNGVGQSVDISPAKNIKSLSLEFVIITRSFSPTPSLHTMEILKEPVVNWLKYVKLKYPTTTKLALKATDMATLPAIPEMEGHVINIISTMPNLTSYAVDFHPLTANIVDAIDNNNIKLEILLVRMYRDEDVKKQLQVIQSSRQVETIKSLNIRARLVRLNGKVFTPALLSLAHKIPNLVDLSVYSILTQSVYVDILQDLTNLEKLTVESFDIPDDYDDDLESRVIVKKSKIKQLHIVAYSEEPGNMDQINAILKFTLQSCPAVQSLTLAGEFACESPNIIKLHFTSHPQLKHIKVDLDNINHYTFSKIPEKKGKKRLDYNTQAPRPFEDALYHADLVWKGDIELGLQRAKLYPTD